MFGENFFGGSEFGQGGLGSLITTGCSLELYNEFSSASGTYIGYSWIAIGT